MVSPRVKVASTELLEMAQQGEPRPSQRAHRLGKMLSYMTCDGHPYFDAEFNHQIREVRPDWFKGRTKN